MYAVIEHLKMKILSLAVTRWFCISHMLNATHEHRVLIIDNFESVEEQDDWSANNKVEATG